MEAQSTTATAGESVKGRFEDMARTMWSAGDFARVAARLVLAGEVLCRSVDVHAGERVLDVAAGSGHAAISAARRGARVTASDFVESLLQAAQTRAQAEGLSLATAVADTQDLPFEDESFDVVLSTFGVMFAPDQRRAIEELLRVCRPDGQIGLANWVPDGLMASNQAILQKHLRHRRRLPGCAGRSSLCASSAAELVQFNCTWFGPARTAFARLDQAGQASLAADLTATLEHFNRATDGTLVAEAEYLVAVAVKA